MREFSKSIELPVSAEQAFRWHERDGALELLTPPWVKAEVLESGGGIQDGGYVEVRLGVFGPFSITARHEHSDYRPGELFVDEQVRGPFSYWRHEHRFKALSENRCELEDHITYKPPFGVGWYVQRQLERMFRYRHQVTLEALRQEAV